MKKQNRDEKACTRWYMPFITYKIIKIKSCCSQLPWVCDEPIFAFHTL